MSADDDKRAAQTAFLNAENIRELYQQIVAKGTIGESLTLQITQERFPEIAPVVQPEIQREKDVEPER